ncbi:MAG: hypothetical protein [Bacteriophage sp.]|nr:MAG: hypothetical protein [Bacteriophage sp.]
MDKVILGRLASFNLSMQQKRDLIEVIKYVAKYRAEDDNEEEIKRLIAFLNQYKIREDGTFPDFEEYVSNFDSLNTKFNDYVTSHTEELKQYVKNETIEELKTDINDKFSAINTKFEGIESLISEI